MTRHLVTMTIDDFDLPIVRHIESATILNKPTVEGYSFREPALPCGQDEAREFMDANGFATTIIEVDLETFIQGIADTTAETDIHDLLHAIAFGGFGVTQDSSYEVLGVVGESLLVIKYTTLLSPFFEEDAR